MDRLVGFTFILTPVILFSLWIFSVCRENKKDMRVFGLLFLGALIGIVCAFVAHVGTCD